MRTLEQMNETAQRQLDGMTVNRDLMAKDVQHLVEMVRRLEAVIKVKKAMPGVSSGIFGSAFDDIINRRA